MSEQKPGQQEPTMEEILASIRRIISDNDGPSEAGSAKASSPDGKQASDNASENASPKAEATPESAVSETQAGQNPGDGADDDDDEDILELVDTVGNEAVEAPDESRESRNDEAIVAESPPIEDDDTLILEDALPEDTDITGDRSPTMATPGYDDPGPEEQGEDRKSDEAPAASPQPGEGTADFRNDLVSAAVAAQATAAFARLSREIENSTTDIRGTTGNLSLGTANTLEDLVRDMLRPMLREWLDQNLPILVERLVRREIRRMAHRAEDD